MANCRVLESGVCGITQPYHINGQKGYNYDHWGIDLTDMDGDVHVLGWEVAHSDGVVVGYRNDCPGYEDGSYGNYVLIEHANGYYTMYAHIAYGTVQVVTGQTVKRGQRIGYMGNTGHSFGGHLHFEVRQPNGYQIDPEAYLYADLPGMGVTPNVARDVYKNQVKVFIEDLFVREGAGTDKGVLGFASKGFYNVYGVSEADGYKWLEIADGQFIAFNEEDKWNKYYEAKERPATVIYQVRGDRYYDWLPNVENDSDYAGLYGDAVSGFMANMTKGNITYAAHVKGAWWLPWVINRSDYAGSVYKGENIDAICIKSDIPVKYRVHILGGSWLPWVRSKNANINDKENGYAGIIGKVIDGIQITVE